MRFFDGPRGAVQGNSKAPHRSGELTLMRFSTLCTTSSIMMVLQSGSGPPKAPTPTRAFDRSAPAHVRGRSFQYQGLLSYILYPCEVPYCLTFGMLSIITGVLDVSLKRYFVAWISFMHEFFKKEFPMPTVEEMHVASQAHAGWRPTCPTGCDSLCTALSSKWRPPWHSKQ